MGTAAPRRRYWRLYRTSLDHRVIRDELLALPREAYAEVKGAMDDVEDLGLQTSKRLRNEIREIDAGDPTQGTTYRLLFAVDGREGQILLGLVFFNKKTRRRLLDTLISPRNASRIGALGASNAWPPSAEVQLPDAPMSWRTIPSRVYDTFRDMKETKDDRPIRRLRGSRE